MRGRKHSRDAAPRLHLLDERYPPPARVRVRASEQPVRDEQRVDRAQLVRGEHVRGPVQRPLGFIRERLEEVVERGDF